jgi:hypothetical protein
MRMLALAQRYSLWLIDFEFHRRDRLHWKNANSSRSSSTPLELNL